MGMRETIRIFIVVTKGWAHFQRFAYNFMHWEWIKIIDRFIWTKEIVIYLWNILDVKCTHKGDFQNLVTYLMNG